jgi:hypothetical protein
MSEIDSTIPLKRCTKCCLEHPATREFFPPQRKGSEVLHTWCKSCHRENARKRRQNPEVREQQREYDRKRSADPVIQDRKREQRRERAKNPEVLNRLNNYQRNLYRESPRYREYMREKNQQRRQDPRKREHILDYDRKRNHDPKRIEHQQLRGHNRRARKRQLPNTMTTTNLKRMMEYWGHRCAVCGRLSDFWTIIALDHWIPLSSPDCPGTTVTNTVPLCHAIKGVPAGTPLCNTSKSDKDPHTWLIQRFGTRKANQILKKINAYFEWVKTH